MNLIKISDKVMVNPDAITSVEIRGTGDNRKLTIRVGNKEFPVSDPKDFFLELVNAGVGASDQFFRM